MGSKARQAGSRKQDEVGTPVQERGKQFLGWARRNPTLEGAIGGAVVRNRLELQGDEKRMQKLTGKRSSQRPVYTTDDIDGEKAAEGKDKSYCFVLFFKKSER